MKAKQLFLAVAIVVCLGGLRANANTIPINIDVSQSTALSGDGSELTVSFTNNRGITDIYLGGNEPGVDSAFNAPLSFNGGNFTFAANGSGAGTFTGGNGTFTMGTLSTSGTVTGSISSVSITFAGVNGSTYSYDVNFNFANLVFNNCTGAGCTNSTGLQEFASGSTGNAILNFTLAGSQYSSLAQMLDLNTGTGSPIKTGGSGSLNDTSSSVTPEPASLALFGSGLAIFGSRLRRRQKKA